MNKKKVILVSGASGQLGKTLVEHQEQYQDLYDFVFLSRPEFDLEDAQHIEEAFTNSKPDIFLNFAAYTQVDKAEEEQQEAFLINENACSLIARQCAKHGCYLIHVSTDYVYNGVGPNAFKETDYCDPINVYGKSKLAGEKAILEHCSSSAIIRTSWLYSKHRNNFVKSMIRLGQERDVLNVVNDQIGSPTWTEDLIHAIFALMEKRCIGIFNYSNEGSCTWYEFARSIMSLKHIDCVVKPIPSSEFPTAAKRPSFSLMDKTKIIQHTGISIPDWRASLKKALQGF